MTDTVLEGNKLIAEFMGWTLYTPKYKGLMSLFNKYDKPVYLRPEEGVRAYTLEKMEYQYDWNWLMTAVQKIESLENKQIRVRIEGYFCDILQTKRDAFLKENGGFYEVLLVSNKHNDKLFLVWKSVVEFIQLYNITKH